MSSFSWLGMFAVNDYMQLREYLLKELRNVNSQARQIDTEIKRIGTAQIIWEKDEQGNATEKRKGMVVRPANSSLNKLMRAYIALGGNPFDICMYLDPNKGVKWVPESEGSDSLKMVFKQPYGGMISVRTRESPTAQYDDGGELIYPKNFRLRAGKEMRYDRAEVVGEHVASAREWANQGIKEKRTDIEWRIVKLLDLAEQLEIERAERLYHDVCGMVAGIDFQNTYDYFHTLKHHIITLDKIVFALDENELPIYGKMDVAAFTPGQYDYIIPSRQLGEDDWTGGKTPFNCVMSGEERVDIIANLAAPDTGLDEDMS
tara:strand:- start:1352 stop:2302 length:951 start_codon:yes stop_codon:yes gene_type:complete